MESGFLDVFLEGGMVLFWGAERQPMLLETGERVVGSVVPSPDLLLGLHLFLWLMGPESKSTRTGSPW